jgi:transcriptional regulator with XRE-family HTH domain
MNGETMSSSTVHHGRNIKRLREMLGVKQEVIALELNVTQQAVSELEKKEQINEETLEKVAKILKVPANAIRNFNDEKAINIISNTFQDESNNIKHYQCAIVQSDKVIELYEQKMELYERVIKEKEERIHLLEQLLKEKE